MQPLTSRSIRASPDGGNNSAVQEGSGDAPIIARRVAGGEGFIHLLIHHVPIISFDMLFVRTRITHDTRRAYRSAIVPISCSLPFLKGAPGNRTLDGRRE